MAIPQTRRLRARLRRATTLSSRTVTHKYRRKLFRVRRSSRRYNPYIDTDGLGIEDHVQPPVLTTEKLNEMRENAQASVTEALIGRVKAWPSDLVDDQSCDDTDGYSRITSVRSVVLYHGQAFFANGGHGPPNRANELSQIKSISGPEPEEQMAQIVFFLNGCVRIEFLPILDAYSSPQIRRGYWECGCKGKHSDTCYSFASNMLKAENGFLSSIITSISDFITLLVALNPMDSSMLDAKDRLQYWREALDRKVVNQSLIVLQPGVDVTTVLDSPRLFDLVKTLLALVADDIFLFVYGQPNDKDSIDLVRLRYRHHCQLVWQGMSFGDIPCGQALYV